MESLVRAQRAECIERVWSLREDPSYFTEIVRDLSEHSVQPASFGEGKQTANPVDRNDVLCTVVHDAYSLVGAWDIICRKLSELSQIRIRYGTEEL